MDVFPTPLSQLVSRNTRIRRRSLLHYERLQSVLGELHLNIGIFSSAKGNPFREWDQPRRDGVAS